MWQVIFFTFYTYEGKVFRYKAKQPTPLLGFSVPEKLKNDTFYLRYLITFNRGCSFYSEYGNVVLTD